MTNNSVITVNQLIHEGMGAELSHHSPVVQSVKVIILLSKEKLSSNTEAIVRFSAESPKLEAKKKMSLKG